MEFEKFDKMDKNEKYEKYEHFKNESREKWDEFKSSIYSEYIRKAFVELFGYDEGREWVIGHFLFKNKASD